MIRLALLEGLDPGNLVDILGDGVGDPVEEGGPLERRPVPVLVLGFACCGHRTVDVGAGRQRHAGDVLTRCRADQLMDRIAGALGPFTGDI